MPEDDASLLVRAGSEPWRQPEQVGYLSEADLQSMLAAEPTLIPGIGPHALAVRKFSTGIGPSDVIVVDLDGSLTVVECKLASNAEIRRKIVGQVLDYAARLWRMTLTDFEARWRQCSGGTGLLDLLEQDASASLETALQGGAFRLVLAVDTINEDLRRIVEYLNALTTDSVTVLALELRRSSHAGVDILIPRTFGGELARAKQDQAQRQRRPAWTIDDVRNRLQERDPDLLLAFDRMSDALLGLGCTAEGTSGRNPSMTFTYVMADGTTTWPYAIYTDDRLSLNFDWIPKPHQAGFLEALTPMTGLDSGAVVDAGYRKRPGVDLRLITDDAVQARLVEAIAKLTNGARSVLPERLGDSAALPRDRNR